MRLLGKISLGLSLVLSFLVLLVLITSRYQLLDENFWITSLREGKVYDKLDTVLVNSNKSILGDLPTSKIEAEIPSLFSSSFIQDFTERNISHVLGFINNKVSIPTIYFPSSHIPKELRSTLGIDSDEIPLTKLTSALGQNTPIGEDVFLQMRALGGIINTSFIVGLITVLIHIVLLYFIEENDKKLKSLGISLIISGIAGLLFSLLINIQSNTISADLTLPSKEPVQIILGTLMPPLTANIIKIWIIVSVITIFLGIGTLFLKKKAINFPKLKKNSSPNNITVPTPQVPLTPKNNPTLQS